MLYIIYNDDAKMLCVRKNKKTQQREYTENPSIFLIRHPNRRETDLGRFGVLFSFDFGTITPSAASSATARDVRRLEIGKRIVGVVQSIGSEVKKEYSQLRRRSAYDMTSRTSVYLVSIVVYRRTRNKVPVK